MMDHIDISVKCSNILGGLYFTGLLLLRSL